MANCVKAPNNRQQPGSGRLHDPWNDMQSQKSLQKDNGCRIGKLKCNLASVVKPQSSPIAGKSSSLGL